MTRPIHPIYQVQFPEKNFSAKEIQSLSGNGLLVRSVFHTIQGEGPYAGYPAVFIRLAGCNRGAKIDCSFCDTDFLVEKSSIKSVKELVAQVVGYHNRFALDKPLVVITGGEPIMHGPLLNTLVRDLNDIGYTVQIETNGDLVRLSSVPRAVIVMSPKVNARSGRYTKMHKEALERADYLKFVVSADPNSPYHTIPEYAYEFADRKGSYHVFVSPISEYARELRSGELATMWGDLYDKPLCRANYKYAAEVSRDKSFRLSIQMHTHCELE